ncbi:DUF1707 SHOCT-like domain-containing protein [Nocardioides rubriscoriae]|uniref:DUF1707 SHOCT-like domain-containing protein n=1 Tax=Nocardioides rubriscoriae TaxID=642762 RepID=UPI0011DFAB9C|nr:DUF1707 domain-containing protein [Nocardioides rubriscoriae]
MAHGVDLWSTFPLDPRDRAHAGLRASDEDRDRITGVLTSAFADGRLERDELEERMADVAAARTLGELPPLVSDLVPLKPPAIVRPSSLAPLSPAEIHDRAVETWHSRRRSAVFSFLTVLVVTGFVASFDIYWPLAFAALSLLNLGRVLASRDEIVRDEARRLEKKQARQQRWPKGLA